MDVSFNSNVMKAIISMLAFFTVVINQIIGQFGTLDSTFNEDGKVTSEFSFGWDVAVALQSDGKIVVAGTVNNGANMDFGVIRYNTYGSLDTAFGVQGKIATQIGSKDDYVGSIKIQPDGKILVAGTPQDTIGHFALIRYLTDGVIDSTFGIDGIQTTTFDPFAYCTSMAIQTNGKIILAGHSGSEKVDFALVRYHPDGTIDSSFGTVGKITTDIGFEIDNGANAVAIQTDGKIVAGGFSHSYPVGDFCLIRYNVDGSLDSTFSMDGKVTTSISQFADNLSALAIQSDGKIIAVGYTNSGDPNHMNYDFAVTRYNVDGSLDTDFGTDGKVLTSFGASDDAAHSVAIQPDGKIIVVRLTSYFQDSDFALARYNSDGTLDESWGTDGMLTTDFALGSDGGRDVAIQQDGKIVSVGSYGNQGHIDLALARYISGLKVGVVNFSPAGNLLIYPNPIQDKVVLEYTLQQDEILNIELYDIFGRLIKILAFQVEKSKGAHQEFINIDENLNSGIYFLRLANHNGSISIKLLKQ